MLYRNTLIKPSHLDLKLFAKEIPMLEKISNINGKREYFYETRLNDKKTYFHVVDEKYVNSEPINASSGDVPRTPP